MTVPACPNYGNCIPGIACAGAEGCLLFKMELSLQDLEINQKAHLEEHREFNGDLHVVAEWAHDLVVAKRIFSRWVRPPVVAVGAAIIGMGAVAGALSLIILLWERVFGI